MLAYSRRWTRQPPERQVAANGLPSPRALFRPQGARQHDAHGVVSSSTYAGSTFGVGLGGVGVSLDGASDSGIRHTFTDAIDRFAYSVAILFSLRSIAANNNIFGINGILQVRATTGGQIEFLTEAVSSNATSTFGGVTANRLHCLVVTNQSGGPLIGYFDGFEVVRFSAGQDVQTTDKYLTLGKRNNAGEVMNGVIYEAAYWSGITLDAATAARISAAYYPSVFAPRRIWVPQAAITGLPTLSLPTYTPGSLTAAGFRPRVTAT